MNSSLAIDVVTIAIIIIANIVTITVLISRLGLKITHLENEVYALKRSEIQIHSKIEVLNKIEAQLELLIPHLFPVKL